MGTIWRLGAYKCKKIKGWLPGIIIAQGLDTLNPKAIIGAIPVAERSSRERCAAPLGSRCAAPHLIWDPLENVGATPPDLGVKILWVKVCIPARFSQDVDGELGGYPDLRPRVSYCIAPHKKNCG